MEKYHIYEEIGKGEFSQVFKGREKKRIEYVAIKRIEKSVMNKIINEVNIMHRLNNAHMLKFHDWYETKNNLWLILEYCTGGNLESILSQDGHLPEHAIRIFGLDMVAALKYLHSIGYIHGDIRPKNFLIDEYGILKLTDFKFTIKIPKERLEDKPIESRGFPPYMAPELFTSDGVHSFQSDFWSLGCVLYELRRGQPPFGGSNLALDRLMNNIRSVEPIHAPLSFSSPNREKSKAINLPPVSAELADLLMWLLEKAPMNRCGWKELTVHPFWKPSSIPPPTELPPQPAFEKLVRELEKARSDQLESASNAEYNLSTDDIQAYNNSLLQNQSLMQAVGHPSIQETPIKKMLPHVDSTPSRPEGARSSRRNNKNSTEPKNNPNNHYTKVLNPIGEEIKEEKEREKSTNPKSNQRPESETPRERQTPTPLTKAIEIPATREEEVTGKQKGFPPTSIATPLATAKTPGGGFEAAGGLDFPLHQLSPDVLLTHASDTQVKPIVGNKQIETIERMDYLDSTLPFEGLKIDQLARLSQTDLEVHLTQVYKALNKTIINAQSNSITTQVANALTDRVNILGYLCSISSSAEVANVILNTHFLLLILKVVKMNPIFTANNPRINNSPSSQSTNSSNVNQLSQQSRYLSATVLAVMLRYATFIQPPSIRARDEHIISTLVSLLKDGNRGNSDHKLRKRLTAAFGEIVFYVSSQEEDGSSVVLDGNGEPQDKWILPGATVDLFLKCLKDDSDEIVKHYAAKTIENVMAQGSMVYRRKFSVVEIGQLLLEISQTSRNEALQGTASMAVVHMMHLVMSAPYSYAFAGGELDQSALSPQQSISNPKQKKSSNNPTTPNNPITDVFLNPSLLTSGKFLLKLFEKFNFISFFETLKDSSNSGNALKLQQSYLNVLNCLLIYPFHGPLGKLTSNGEVGNNRRGLSLFDFMEFAINVSNSASSNNSTTNNNSHNGRGDGTNTTLSLLNAQPSYQQYIQDGLGDLGILSSTALINAFQTISSIRHFFVRSASTTIVPILLKLVEQSSINIIRAKALLAYQLLCLHIPKILLLLPERRLPMILVRIIEPILTHSENTVTKLIGTSNKDQASNNESTTKDNTIQSNYLLKNSLSFLLFLKQTCHRSLQIIQLALNELSTLPLDAIISGSNTYNPVIEGTPLNAHSNAATVLYDKSPAVTYGKSPSSPVRPTNQANKTDVNSLKSPLSQQQQQKLRQVHLEKVLGICRQLKQSSDVLRAIVTVMNQPALCRLLLAGNCLILLELVQVIKVLPVVRTLVNNGSSSANSSRGTSAAFNEILESIIASEQSCLACLECIAQIEIPESIDLKDLFQQFSSTQQPNYHSENATDPNHPNVLLAPFQPNWLLYIVVMFLSIFPNVNKLLAHPEGDIRVLVTAFLLKTAPAFSRLYCQIFILDRAINLSPTFDSAIILASSNPVSHCEVYHQHQSVISELLQCLHPSGGNSFYSSSKVLAECFSGIFQGISSLLTDQPPIPQYLIRLMNELMEYFLHIHRTEIQQHGKGASGAPVASTRLTVVHTVLQEMVQTMKSSGMINILIHLLKANSNQLQQQTALQQQKGEEDYNLAQQQQFVSGLDTQLILLLRNIFEWNKESAVLLLESDVASSLSVAMIASVYTNIQYPFLHPLTYQRNHPSHHSAVPIDLNVDVLVPLMDLVHLVLHFVLREVSAVASAMNQPPSAGSAVSTVNTQQYQIAEQHKRLISGLKAITPALLLLIVYIESYVDETSSFFEEAAKGAPRGNNYNPTFLSAQDQHNHQVKLHLLETSTRCLGILFDLFSDTITNQLLSKQSVILDNQQLPSQSFVPSSPYSVGGGNNRTPPMAHLNPRTIFSKVMGNRKIELKVVLKMMKIFFGLVKVSVNLNAVSKIKDFIATDVVQHSLYNLVQFVQEKEQQQVYANRGGGGEVIMTTELVSIGKIAQQILEIGKSLN